MKLEEEFIKYKDITLNIIEIVKAEEEEKLDVIFNERQLILDNIKKLNCSKEELKKFYLKYSIDKLEKILTSEIQAKKEEVLKNLKQNQKRQVAMNGYNNLQAKAVFLSKEL